MGTTIPYARRRRNLLNRVAFLCDEDHLIQLYQPIFDLTTRRPIGCEVLTRMKEGKRSWMPDTMIPAIQSAGLEEKFDHAVTKKAIRALAGQLPAWKGRFSIALNYFPESINPDVLIPVLNDAIHAQTVAEGIENLEQARLLAQAGIRYGQGYALGRPMELKEFIALIATFQ